MAFLMSRTALELDIFQQSSLQKLYRIRDNYEGNIRENKKRILEGTHQLELLKAQLIDAQTKLQHLISQENEAVRQEETRRQNLADAQQDLSPDNYTVRSYYLNYSPLRDYYEKITTTRNTIQRLTEKIATIEATNLLLAEANKSSQKTLNLVKSAIESKEGEPAILCDHAAS